MENTRVLNKRCKIDTYIHKKLPVIVEQKHRHKNISVLFWSFLNAHSVKSFLTSFVRILENNIYII